MWNKRCLNKVWPLPSVDECRIGHQLANHGDYASFSRQGDMKLAPLSTAGPLQATAAVPLHTLKGLGQNHGIAWPDVDGSLSAMGLDS
jgi:hypothetical protein